MLILPQVARLRGRLGSLRKFCDLFIVHTCLNCFPLGNHFCKHMYWPPMVCQMPNQALGHHDKEATVLDHKELTEGGALSFNPSPITEQNEPVSHQLASLQPPDQVLPEGTQSKPRLMSPEHLQRKALTPRTQTSPTTFSSRTCLLRGPSSPGLLFLFQGAKGQTDISQRPVPASPQPPARDLDREAASIWVKEQGWQRGMSLQCPLCNVLQWG